jgi:hypothetical protein
MSHAAVAMNHPDPRTNTARELVVALDQAHQDDAPVGEIEILYRTALSSLDSQWEDLTDLREKNHEYAQELARLNAFVARLEEENTKRCLQFIDEQNARLALAQRIGTVLGELAAVFHDATELRGRATPPSTSLQLGLGLRPDTDAAGDPRVLTFPPVTPEVLTTGPAR